MNHHVTKLEEITFCSFSSKQIKTPHKAGRLNEALG